jgi:hypothetical protein
VVEHEAVDPQARIEKETLAESHRRQDAKPRCVPHPSTGA